MRSARRSRGSMRNNGWRRSGRGGGRGGGWSEAGGHEAAGEADGEACRDVDSEASAHMLYEKTLGEESGKRNGAPSRGGMGTVAVMVQPGLLCVLGLMLLAVVSLSLAVVSVVGRDRQAQKGNSTPPRAAPAGAPPAGWPPPPPAASLPGPAPPAGKMPSFQPCTWYNGTQDAALVLLKGGIVYTPQLLGRRHVLVGGGRVLRMFEESEEEASLRQLGLVTVVDVTDLLVVPGFVDMHVHVTGGGGESGPESKVPESRLSDLFKGGLTTVVGVLGTDSVSRSAAELLTKVSTLSRSPLPACGSLTGNQSSDSLVPLAREGARRSRARTQTRLRV